MLRISTSGVCPKCGKPALLYEDGKFVCSECGKQHTSKEIIEKIGDSFDIMTDITEKEFREKIKQLDSLCMRFSASYIGCDTQNGMLYYGWDDGYPVRLNMLVQELNEILD
jgi:hypothetical protein